MCGCVCGWLAGSIPQAGKALHARVAFTQSIAWRAAAVDIGHCNSAPLPPPQTRHCLTLRPALTYVAPRLLLLLHHGWDVLGVVRQVSIHQQHIVSAGVLQAVHVSGAQAQLARARAQQDPAGWGAGVAVEDGWRWCCFRFCVAVRSWRTKNPMLPRWSWSGIWYAVMTADPAAATALSWRQHLPTHLSSPYSRCSCLTTSWVPSGLLSSITTIS